MNGAHSQPVLPDPAMPDMPMDPSERTRGRYLHTCNDIPMQVDERFVLGAIGPGVVRVRSTRVAAKPTVRLEADVRYAENTVAAVFRWTGSAPPVPSAAVAEYAEGAAVVAARRTVDGRSDVHDPVPGALLPLMRVFMGRAIIAAVGGADIVVPDICDPRDHQALFAPVTDRRHAERLHDSEIVIDGVARAGTAYRWVGGSYDGPGAEFILDEGGLLLGYSWGQPGLGRWDVRLTEVSGPWPTPGTWGAGQGHSR